MDSCEILLAITDEALLPGVLCAFGGIGAPGRRGAEIWGMAWGVAMTSLHGPCSLQTWVLVARPSHVWQEAGWG